jgi:hypothetical protein
MIKDMFVKTFLQKFLDDPEYPNIKYETLKILHTLPSIVDDYVILQMAFALTSAPKPNGGPLNIKPPFCRCYMSERDLKLIWEKDKINYIGTSNQNNSLLYLVQEVLGDEYSDSMNFSDYKNYLEVLDGIDYFHLLGIIVDKAIIKKESLSQREKKEVLDILFFFNGVPDSLAFYYNQEGKFLADWLRANCL